MSSFVRVNPQDYFRKNDTNAAEFARNTSAGRTFEGLALPQVSEGLILALAGIALFAFLAFLAFLSREK